MSEMEAVPDGVDLAQGEAALAAAAAQLRSRPVSARAVEVADRVLERALSAPRRAVLVETAVEHLRVSSVAVVALLRDALASGLADAVVRRVRLDVGSDGVLTGVYVELVVQYASSIPDVAQRASDIAGSVVADTLGAGPAPGAAGVAYHVHVSDVTVADPRLVDPFDEGLEPA